MNEKQITYELERRVFWQRLALAWERLWPALYWPLIVTGAAIAILASGVLALLPQQAGPAILLALVLLFVLSLRDVVRLAWPKRLAAMRKLEENSQINHRAVSSRNDDLAKEFLDPRFEAIWEEHQRRQLLALENVKLAAPTSSWRGFDPRALRVPVAMAALAALVLGPGTVAENLQNAASFKPPVPAKPFTLDAWLKPPAYTGKPPLLLSSPQIIEKVAKGEEISVPENSVFTARISGAEIPVFKVLSAGGASRDDLAKSAKVAEDTLAIELKLAEPLTLMIGDEAKGLQSYPIILVPDQAPTIAVTADPKAETRGKLVVEWQVKDDYGVKSVINELSLADEQENGVGFESNGIFLYDPPQMKFNLKRPNAKDDKVTSAFDLAAHPWAGFRVSLDLTAKDGAGQEGKVEGREFTLPERQFARPMAQALIEQRKQLILFPEKARDVAVLLDTLMLFPEGLVNRSGHIVAISAISSRLRNATGYDDVKFAVAQLWDVAVSIEEGSVEDLRAELEALKKELEKAIQDGASEERIAELTEKLRKAMEKFMQAMREESERMSKEGKLQPPPEGSKSISREDLQKMLDAIEEMAKQGNREMAQQLLDELNKMLQNMQPGMAQQGGEGQEGEGQMGQMLNELGQMMRKQQGLMDDTQRQGQDGQQGEGQQGEQGEEGNRGDGMGGLADRQKSLQEMLDKLLGQGQGGTPEELGQALEDMKQAEEGLRGGDKEQSLKEQGEALDNMRKGANRMAQQMRENGQGQADNDARDGEGRAGNDDPLGRPRATRNPDLGPDEDIVPKDQAIRRAREILEQLRARSNDQGLSDQEKSYLERLLRGLY